ncbi:MAG: hypothetical protein V2A69_00505, partial [Pseudomonadota bacterium]
MKHIKKFLTTSITIFVFFLAINVSLLHAQMMGGGTGMTNYDGFGTGMMTNNGGFGMMTNSGGFGMMNGMAGSPVVGDDGTVYLVSYEPNLNPGTIPNSNSFTSRLMAIKPDTGEVASLNLNGILSRPVVSGNILVATASLPNFSNFYMMENYGINNSNQQSVLYGIQLPLTASTVPTAVSLDGSFASVPVIANNLIYVSTTNYGNFMMGQSMFEGMFEGFDFSNQGNLKSYLYVIGLDG